MAELRICDGCDHCSYDPYYDYFYCNVTDERVELYDEACSKYISEIDLDA